MNSLSMLFNLLLVYVAFSTFFTGINCSDGTYNLKKHKKTATEGSKYYFENNIKKIRQQVSHKVRQYKCDKYIENFTEINNLEQHKQIAHEGRHKCQKCEYKFTKTNNLRNRDGLSMDVCNINVTNAIRNSQNPLILKNTNRLPMREGDKKVKNVNRNSP